jgi:uncharacterized protein YndB with AHSA1/START domain
MAKYDFLSEGVIEAPPMAVYKAILNEASGVTHWWMPYCEFKLKGDMPIDREGAIFDIIVHGAGSPKFSAKMVKIVEAKLIEEEYTGDFVGTGTWTFEPTDGKTKLQYRFNVRTNKLLYSLGSSFVNMEKMHSGMVQKGFKGLNSYLNQKSFC